MDAFLQALMSARRSGRRVDASTLMSPDYRQAFLIQQKVQALIGPVGGFKVARRTDGPPAIAPTPANNTFPSGSEISIRDVMGIELEIGFEALSDFSAGMIDAPSRYFRPRIVLELVDARLTNIDNDSMKKLADMQITEGLVVGAAFDDWDGSDFSTVRANMRCGERHVVDGTVGVPGGSALAALGLFLDNVGNHCGGLRAGQIVITGSLSGLEYFEAGTEVAGSIEGIGAVSCHLTSR
jgi:2-keto-4-pentenoate hydratase